MTPAVVWEPVAVDLATRFLADDPEGLRNLFEAVDALADEPRPPQAFPLGTSGLYRLAAEGQTAEPLRTFIQHSDTGHRAGSHRSLSPHRRRGRL